jgi:DNA-binding response OmpR family regulator
MPAPPMPDGPVLLVEDETVLREALADALRRHGMDTVEASNAEDAADQLAAGLRPGLVFLDLNLPGRSGWELLQTVLAPAIGRPAVVILTAQAVNPARLRQYAVDGYLPKPFAMATFLATAQRLLAPS